MNVYKPSNHHKLVAIDFEFNNSQEYNVNLVCCSLALQGQTAEEYWLLNNPSNQKKLSDRIMELADDGYGFIAHAATAEGRSVLSLGINPTHLRWMDTYLIRKQLINKCDKYTYGTYFKKGVACKSVPPSFHSWKNAGVDNLALGAGLADTVGRHLGICIDTDHKDQMRDIIIRGDDVEIEANRKAIQDYCTSDILYLHL